MKWYNVIFLMMILWLIIALIVYTSTNPFTATPSQMLLVAVITVMGMILFALGIIALGYEIAENVRKYFEKQSKSRD